MDKLKQWVALTAVACLAVAAAGWFLLVSPKRAQAAELRAQAAEQVNQNAQARTRLQVLKAQAKDLPKEQAKLAAVAAKIPDNPALPGLVRSLLEAATSAGVELVSITPGQPAAVTPKAGAPGAPAAAAPLPAAPSATPSAAAPASPTGGSSLSPSAKAPGSQAGTLAHIPVSLNVVGDYFEIQQFLAAVENLPRAMRVAEIQMAPGASPVNKTANDAAVKNGRSLTATIKGDVFMAVNRSAAAPVSVPAAAAPPAPATAAAPVK